MSGNFHRLTVPGYFVASAPFPTEAGVTYDYVNNAGAGTPSNADSAKIGGPNAGTYFIAFGEDATTNNANRGLKAIAQNCDHLDDTLHRSLSLPVRTNDATAGGGGVTTIVLPAGTYLGPSGTTNTAASLETIFDITDSNDNEILNGSTKCAVTTVTLSGGDTLGTSSFSTNTVQLNISATIPAATVYRVYYGTRSNLATLPTDAFSFIRIRGAQDVAADVEKLFYNLRGNGAAWDAAWPNTIFTLDASITTLQARATADEVLIASTTARLNIDESISFIEPGDGLGQRTGVGATVGELAIASWHQKKKIISQGDDDTLKSSVDGGYTWSTELTIGGATFTGIANSSFNATMAIYDNGGGRLAVQGTSGPSSWTNEALTGGSIGVPQVVVASPSQAFFYVGGSQTTGPDPRIWRIGVAGVTPTSQALVTCTGGTAPIRCIAAGSSIILAATDTRLFSFSSGGAGSATAQTSPTGTTIVDVLWIASANYFLLIASNGTSTLEFWTSATGATGTWTAQSFSLLGGGNAFAFLRGALVVPDPTGIVGQGSSVILLPIGLTLGSTTRHMLVSTDGGVTWKALPNPMSRHQSASPIPVFARVRQLGNRIAAMGVNGSGVLFTALGIRGGAPV